MEFKPGQHVKVVRIIIDDVSTKYLGKTGVILEKYTYTTNKYMVQFNDMVPTRVPFYEEELALTNAQVV